MQRVVLGWMALGTLLVACKSTSAPSKPQSMVDAGGELSFSHPEHPLRYQILETGAERVEVRVEAAELVTPVTVRLVPSSNGFSAEISLDGQVRAAYSVTANADARSHLILDTRFQVAGSGLAMVSTTDAAGRFETSLLFVPTEGPEAGDADDRVLHLRRPGGELASTTEVDDWIRGHRLEPLLGDQVFALAVLMAHDPVLVAMVHEALRARATTGSANPSGFERITSAVHRSYMCGLWGRLEMDFGVLASCSKLKRIWKLFKDKNVRQFLLEFFPGYLECISSFIEVMDNNDACLRSGARRKTLGECVDECQVLAGITPWARAQGIRLKPWASAAVHEDEHHCVCGCDQTACDNLARKRASDKGWQYCGTNRCVANVCSDTPCIGGLTCAEEGRCVTATGDASVAGGDAGDAGIQAPDGGVVPPASGCLDEPAACRDPQRPQPPPCAGPACALSSRAAVALSTGDPHLRTFDGLFYSPQSVGELTLVRADSGDLEVQTRTRPVGSRTDVSLDKAVAARVGSHRVAIYQGVDQPLWVDGAEVHLPGGLHPLSGGGAVYVHLGGWKVVWPDGSLLSLARFGAFLHVEVALAPGRREKVSGLLGNFDGDPSNDLVTRAGAPLARPLDREALYGRLIESWRVRPPADVRIRQSGESLFDYQPGETTETFTDRGFPRASTSVAGLAPEVRAAAEETCRRAGVTDQPQLDACVLDVGLTGDPEFASAMARLPPVLDVVPPPPPFGPPAADAGAPTPDAPATTDAAAVRALYDLAADWSDTRNPNGAWSLREGVNVITTTAVDWAGFIGQRAWARTTSGTQFVPAFMKVPAGGFFTGLAQPGDIVVHSQDETSGAGLGQARVVWTAPVSTIIDVDGAVWLARTNLSRSTDWTLSIGGVSRATGTLSPSDGHSRAKPQRFSQKGVAVSEGQEAVLQLSRNAASDWGEFTGVVFTVKLTNP